MCRSPEAVILSAAKDLSLSSVQILRCAQDDIFHLASSFSKKPTCVRTARVARTRLKCRGDPRGRPVHYDVDFPVRAMFMLAQSKC